MNSSRLLVPATLSSSGYPSLRPAETQRTRKAILRAAARSRRRRGLSSRVVEAIRNRFFPLSFFVRNILALQEEPGWRQVSPRIWRGRLHRMLEERSKIFCEVYQWRLQKQKEAQSPFQALPSSLDDLEQPSGYCSHCGGCCEIASGLPDFPLESALPLRWQRLFGDGVGKGHRFCPFLWELNASGLSLCAIHPWRSNPCRIFEEAECAYFMKDSEGHPPFRAQDFSVACQRLSRLVNRR